MSEADRVSNANKACLGAGVNTITAFNQGSTESIFCNAWYELIVETELSLYEWRFATELADLSNSLLGDSPQGKYNTAYQLPSGVLSVDTVMVDEQPIEYDRFQDQIHTSNTEGDILILKYRFRADESLWTPYFQLLVIYRLATMLSFSIARKDDVAASMKGLADEHWRKAKTKDAQSQTNKKVNLRRLTRSRTGQLDKFWRNR
jgi:hypothetical protein